MIVRPLTNSVHLDWMREGSRQSLYLSVSANESGILYKMTAILLAYGWEIKEAVAETSTDGYVRDIFIVNSFLGEILNDELVKEMEMDMKQLLNDYPVKNYLESKNIARSIASHETNERKKVNIYNPVTSDFTLLDIRTTDRMGLLFDISSFLFTENLDIVSFTANTNDVFVRDSFLVLTNEGRKLEDLSRIQEISESLYAIV